MLEDFHPSAEVVRKLCDRHKGIGADGVLVIDNADKIAKMTIYNNDGSISAMCGNGTICAFSYLEDRGVFSRQCPLELHLEKIIVKGSIDKDSTV
jgi:diaminopimelate epimerase